MRFYKMAGAALAALLIVAAPVAPAFAHAELQTATVVTELRLVFSEAVELAFTSVLVTGSDGVAIPTGALSVDPADGKILLVPLTTTPAAGAVKVDWKAVAADGHKSEGSYSFTVTP